MATSPQSACHAVPRRTNTVRLCLSWRVVVLPFHFVLMIPTHTLSLVPFVPNSAWPASSGLLLSVHVPENMHRQQQGEQGIELHYGRNPKRKRGNMSARRNDGIVRPSGIRLAAQAQKDCDCRWATSHHDAHIVQERRGAHARVDLVLLLGLAVCLYVRHVHVLLQPEDGESEYGTLHEACQLLSSPSISHSPQTKCTELPVPAPGCSALLYSVLIGL
ncbi:hypothetical protein BC826DRAFT_1035268 [Russula brevipes]|nr:hypothetical protein BC826DRAFT_1035268 [Russula brevipes]